MGTDLVVAGRTQLAAYAGFSGALLGRARPFAIIAAVDVLAVALAFGALHVTGMMMGGGQVPQLIQPTSAAAEPVAATTPLVPPAPRLAPPRREFAAIPDAAVMFDAPVVAMARGFTFDSAPASSPSAFVPAQPPPVAAADPEPTPVATPTPVPTPHLRPLQQVAALAAPVIDATDGSIDRLLLRDVAPAVNTTVSATGRVATNTAGAVLDGTTTTTTNVVGSAIAATNALTAPVQSVAQNVTRPVTQVVQGVAGLLR